jgi:RimJ/RimL family protein N-acetyltransferase
MSASIGSHGWQRRAALRDGTPVLLRQIESTDRDRLAQGLRELSSDSRYLRFHADVEELSPAELDHLTRVDHRDHEAIVAIDLDRPEVPGIGVARYVRDHYDRDVAEAVVTVADRYHGQGAATLLFGALAARARSEGIEVFRHDVLDANPVMLAFLEHLGATRVRASEDRWQVDLRLPATSRDLPTNAAARAFRAAMRGRPCVDRLTWPSRVPHRSTGLPAQSLADRITAELLEEDGDGLGDAWFAERDRREPHWPSVP